MTIAEAVQLLTEYAQSDDDAFQARYNERALIAMRDMAEVLETQLEDDLRYAAVWEEFQQNPQADAADLTGMLEALVEADPGFAEQIETLVAEFHAAVRDIPGPTAPVEEEPRPETVVTPTPSQPIEPEDVKPRDYRDDADSGTYLYGNVPAGDVTVEPDVEDVPGSETEPAANLPPEPLPEEPSEQDEQDG